MGRAADTTKATVILESTRRAFPPPFCAGGNTTFGSQSSPGGICRCWHSARQRVQSSFRDGPPTPLSAGHRCAFIPGKWQFPKPLEAEDVLAVLASTRGGGRCRKHSTEEYRTRRLRCRFRQLVRSTGPPPYSFGPIPSVFIFRYKLLRSNPSNSAVRVTLPLVSSSFFRIYSRSTASRTSARLPKRWNANIF